MVNRREVQLKRDIRRYGRACGLLMGLCSAGHHPTPGYTEDRGVTLSNSSGQDYGLSQHDLGTDGGRNRQATS
jgi:hypothetical protein